MTQQETCEQRIDRHLQSRIETLRQISEGINPETGNPYEDEDQQYEDADNMILSLDRRITVTVVLSTGGPHDELVFTYNGEPGDHEPDSIDYRFQDWYDGATRRLTGSDYDTALNAYGEHAYHAAYHQ